MSKKTFFELGNKHNIDKVTHHRYDRFYPFFLEGMRQDKFDMLEIGVAEGKSLLFWKEYFPHARVIGLDRDEKHLQGLETYKYDQSKIEEIREASKKLPVCRIIIDDGSHQPKHQIDTFQEFWLNNLEYGGVYILEDIECSYWSSKSKVYGYEIGFFNIVDYLSKTPDYINSEFSGKKNNMNISSVTFAHNCIVIIKKTLEEIEFTKRNYRYKEKL